MLNWQQLSGVNYHIQANKGNNKEREKLDIPNRNQSISGPCKECYEHYLHAST